MKSPKQPTESKVNNVGSTETRDRAVTVAYNSNSAASRTLEKIYEAGRRRTSQKQPAARGETSRRKTSWLLYELERSGCLKMDKEECKAWEELVDREKNGEFKSQRKGNSEVEKAKIKAEKAKIKADEHKVCERFMEMCS